MGDISEMRGLIVVFCIIAVSITLIALMPTEFYTATATSPEVGSGNPLDLIAWNSSLVVNFTGADPIDFTLNGYNFELDPTFDPYTLQDGIILATYDGWWIFVWNYEAMQWYVNDVEVSYTPTYAHTRISIYAVDEYPIDTVYTCKNSRTMVRATFVYNTTEYTKFSDAYKANDASIVFNMDWEDRNTSFNALSLIAMLFTASLPNVDPTINLLITFPIWACIGYLIFIFVLRMVGAIFGGGGA